MRIALVLPVITALALTACQTSSLTEEQKEPVQESSQAFSGEQKQIDTTKSSISFVGKSNIVNHEGKFNTYDAALTLDADEPANLEKASVRATVDISSVEIDAAGLQGHLAKDDFFAVEQFPEATFESTSIVSKGDNMYEVTGDLTIKDMTKTITFDAEITDAYLKAQYDLPRKEFGIGNDNYGDKLLEETVPVNIQLIFQS